MYPDGGPEGNDEPEVVSDLQCRLIPARAESLPGLRRVVAAWARRSGLAAARVDDLVLAVDEAAANVVEHAYPHPGGVLTVLARHRDDPTQVEVTVTDHGRWRPPPRDPGNRGRGLDLIRRLADDVEIRPSDHGTSVHMTWSLTTY
jgi:serine/threonine-protein kinase RsbW